MGVMNIPVVQDERVTQNELNIIAMRKTIKFKVNYYQQRMRNVARRLITSAIPSIYPEKKTECQKNSPMYRTSDPISLNGSISACAVNVTTFRS